MSPLVALLVLAAQPPPLTVPGPDSASAVQRWQVTLGLGAGAEWNRWAHFVDTTFGGDLELGFRPVPWLRLAFLAGAAWAPPDRPTYPGNHGLFRVMGGLDAVAPLSWCDLFLGVVGGVQHTNLFFDDYDPSRPPPERIVPGYTTSYRSGPSLLVRGGLEAHLLRSVTMGGDVACGYFGAGAGDDLYSFELRFRVGFLF